ncbi:hypothetical protein CBM2626_A60321 [Cupriavidus taiwanensis]|nr:hypothetical protein CBM2626_A60321 [Cupriavidus taiwanensis]
MPRGDFLRQRCGLSLFTVRWGLLDNARNFTEEVYAPLHTHRGFQQKVGNPLQICVTA